MELKKKYKAIDVNEVDDLIGKINIIDIREPHEFKAGTIKTAKNIPMGTLLNNPEKYLKKDEAYYILCRSGSRSFNTCKMLLEEGFDVYDVSSGMILYEGVNRI